MKTIHASKTWKRSCALITLFTFLFELVLPAFLPGLSSTAFAAEGDDGSAGSANYYQQELEKFGKGKYHAGESGLMTYSYPLGGGISANYNSEGGWSVGGHSRIARSTKWGVPGYTDDDIFTLNAQELVYASGTNPKIYHTENESYQKIEYHNPGQSDSYWKIYNQDGSWSTYGSTADSRIEAIGKPAEQPRAWAIAESRDKGDYHVTTYAYTEDSTNGSYYLDKIVSGKTGAAADGYKATLIAYETRPDQRTSYRSGAKVKSTKRVTSVVHVIGCDNTGSGGSFVNGYNISWTLSPQTKQSIITAITPYGSDLTVDANGAITGGTSLPATTFDYQAYEGGFETTNEPWSGDTSAYPLRYTASETCDCNDITDGLFACYPFNGNANDESGNGNDGTVYGAILTEDRFGNSDMAYSFDGNNDYIETPDITQYFDLRDENSYPWTFTFWAKSSVSNQNDPDYPWTISQSVLWDDAAFRLGTSDVGYFLYGADKKGSTQIVVIYQYSQDFNYQEWHHYTFTKDDNKLVKLYVDSELKNSGIHDHGIVENEINKLKVGGQQTDKERFWNGLIDDIRIYNRALSEDEIKELHGASITEAELMDINGDGLPDRVDRNGDFALWVRLNHGSSFDAAESLTLPEPEGGKVIRTAAGDDTHYDLIDMNGDGRADRVKKDEDGDILYVHLSTIGTGTYGDYVYFPQTPEEWTNDSTSSRIRSGESDNTYSTTTSDLIDMNGDGLPDRVDSDGSSLAIRFNTVYVDQYDTLHAQFAPEESWNLPDTGKNIRYTENPTTDSTQTTHDLIDMNGDGLPDRLVKTADGDLSVYLNTGSGFESSPQTWSGDTSDSRIRNTSSASGETITTADLMDVNGDGLPDRVTEKSATELEVRLNTGSGFSAPQTWTFPGSDSYLKAVRTSDADGTTHDLMDMNGDGVLDRISKTTGMSSINVFPGKATARSDIFISTITNSLGGSTEYTYKKIDKGLEHYGNDTNPFYKPKHFVVDTVTTDDGLGTPTSRETTTYEYFGGEYNAEKREDYGFGKVVATHPDDNQTEWHYYRSKEGQIDTSDKAGRLKKEVTRGKEESGGTRYIYTYTYYDYEDIAATSPNYGYDISQSRPGAGPDIQVKSVKLTSIDRYLVDGTSWLDMGTVPSSNSGDYKQTRTEYVYSDYGQIETEIDYGEVQGTLDLGNDKVVIETSYEQRLSDWQFLPETVSTYEYGSSGYTQSGQTTYTYTAAGLVEQTATAKDSGTVVTTDMTYDACGNVQTITDPNGNTTSFTYNTRYCAYPETETAPAVNGIPFTTTTEYDSLMRPELVWDVNGNRTKTIYDEFGRIIYILKPGDDAVSPTITYSYGQDGTAPEYLRTVIKDGPLSYIYVDGFGNTIQTKAKGVDQIGTVQWRTTDVWNYVEGDKTVGATSETYFAQYSLFDRPSSPAISETMGRSVAYTKSYLDRNLGRISETTNFKGDTSNVVSKHFETIAVDEELHAAKTILEPAQQRKIIQECTGTTSLASPACSVYAETVYTTSFDQEMITDAEGRVTTRTFNWAGELLTLDDPDLGTRAYTYDNNGNLLTITDAKNQTITYDYDEHDRLTLVDYPTGTDTLYYYDGDDDGDGTLDRSASNGVDDDGDGDTDEPDEDIKGVLGYVTDASGSTKRWYDIRYNVNQEEKTIGSQTATTEFRYDAFKLTGIKYPGDTDWTAYTFNAANEATGLSAPGQAIVNAVTYNPFGKITQLDFGNSTRNAYTYFPASGSFRLQNITVTDAGSQEIMNRSYSYDNVGNILTIDDTNNAYDQSFTYDDLYRLTAQTNASFTGGAETFTYSQTGNIESKNGNAYTYNAGTHQVTNDGVNTYSYDANGNMAGKNSAIYNYDYDNRLIAVNTGESFEYDFSGRRVKKVENGTTTYYFNEYYEVEEEGGTGNQAPVVDAGPDQSTLPNTPLNLDGTVTDDGLPDPPAAVTTTWTTQSGPGTVTFGDINAIDTTVTLSAEGTYVLRLTADDGDLIGFDEVTVIVDSTPNQAPTVNAGTDQTITWPTSSVTLDATITDDGLPNPPGIVNITWSKQSGPGDVIFGDASAEDSTAAFTQEGTYVLRVTADDSDLTAFDELTITVNPPTQNNVVVITVRDTNDTPEDNLQVAVFDGTTYVGYYGYTNASGQISFTLPFGSYRFRAYKDNTFYWSDTVNHCTVPGCTSATVTTAVPTTVTVQDSNGTPEDNLQVAVFDGTTYAGYYGYTNASGQISFTLPFGSYRFRAYKDNTFYWSDTVNHCTVPGCTAVTITTPVLTFYSMAFQESSRDSASSDIVRIDDQTLRINVAASPELNYGFGDFTVVVRTSLKECTDEECNVAIAAKSPISLQSPLEGPLNSQLTIDNYQLSINSPLEGPVGRISHTAAGVRQSDTLFLYLDGELQAQKTIGSKRVKRLNVNIGLEDATDAIIEDVQLFDYALFPEDIAKLSAIEPSAIPLLGGAGVGSPGSAGVLPAKESLTPLSDDGPVLLGDGDGPVVTTTIAYYYLNGQRVAQAKDGVFTWIHADHLSSATRITDVNGLEIRRLAYTSFGEEAENQGTGDDPKYTYTGKEHDTTGLYYYGARYYDPALSRFITADAVYDAGPQGLNRYSYALNNPIVYRDPSGHQVEVFTGAEGVLAAGPVKIAADTPGYVRWSYGPFTVITKGTNVAGAGAVFVEAYGDPKESFNLEVYGNNWNVTTTFNGDGVEIVGQLEPPIGSKNLNVKPEVATVTLLKAYYAPGTNRAAANDLELIYAICTPNQRKEMEKAYGGRENLFKKFEENRKRKAEMLKARLKKESNDAMKENNGAMKEAYEEGKNLPSRIRKKVVGWWKYGGVTELKYELASPHTRDEILEYYGGYENLPWVKKKEDN